MALKKIHTGNKIADKALEWLDAILFAVVVVTLINIFFFQAFKIPSSSMEKSLYTGDHLFVSKLAYGPRMPQTPLTIPFTHNTIGRKESYSSSVQWKYRRLPGFGKVKRGDVVVFNFPNGDTVLRSRPMDDYHALVRILGREAVSKMGPIVVRPMDKKDHYVKRCVAIPGDSLSVRDGLVWVNGEKQEVYPGIQLSYQVITKDRAYCDILTFDEYRKVLDSPNVLSVKPLLDTIPSKVSLEIFPFTTDSGWTRDNYGPIWIPEKGATVKITEANLPLYERIISVYEGGDARKALEDGSYTFEQDYYFMMGDNRHNSLDSRYWGFVPEDHVVGKPRIVWLSTDSEKKFPLNIRWKRFFKMKFN